MEKVAVIGIENNQSTLYIETAHEDGVFQQKYRTFPVQLVVDFNAGDANGELVKITTSWVTVMMSNSGKPLHREKEEHFMSTNAVDRATFLNMLGNPILLSMLNGEVRSIEGFNNQPVVNSTNGAVLPYSPEEEALPPVFSGPGSYNYIAPIDEPLNPGDDETPVNP